MPERTGGDYRVQSLRNQSISKRLPMNTHSRGPQRVREGRGLWILAASLSLAMLFFAAVAVLVYTPRNLLTERSLNPSHVVHYAIYDSRGQTMAHRLLLSLLALTLLCLFIARGISARIVRVMANSSIVTCLLWITLILFGASSLIHFRSVGLSSTTSVTAIVVLGVLFFLKPAWATLRGNPWWVLICLGLISIATAPGVFISRDLSHLSAMDFASVQWHYDYTMGAGDRLASGQKLFEEVTPALGILPAIILGGWQKHLGLLDFGSRQDLLRWAALVFLLTTMFAYSTYARGLYAFAAVGLLLLIPYLHFATPPGARYPSLLYPNQSAWRSIGFAMCPLGLLLVRHAHLRTQSAVAGGLGALAFLLNTESGIALSAGMATFVLTQLWSHPMRQRQRTQNVWSPLLAAISSFFAVVLIAVLLHRAVLGSWANLARTGSLLTTMKAFSSGYGGQRMTWQPVAALIAFHSSYVIVWTCLAGGARGFRSAFRCALAVTMIVWFAYYANRPDDWNLWTFISLYTFFIIDLMILLLGRRQVPTGHWLPKAFAGVALWCVVLPHLVLSGRTAAREMVRTIAHATTMDAPSQTMQVSGIDLPIALAQALTERADAARRTGTNTAPAVLSAYTYFISTITGTYAPIPFGDPFNEVFTPTLYDHLIDSLLSTCPSVLLFDPPGSLLVGSNAQQEYFESLRRDLLPYYRPSGSVGTWEAWTTFDCPGMGSSLQDRRPR